MNVSAQEQTYLIKLFNNVYQLIYVFDSPFPHWQFFCCKFGKHIELKMGTSFPIGEAVFPISP